MPTPLGVDPQPSSSPGDADLPARVDVVVVGAGMAGLRCAQLLARTGVDVLVVEAGDAVGGRVRTDIVDGFRLDRGFQLINPAYPEVPRALDVDALDLCPVPAGVVAAGDGRQHVLADPRRVPSAAWSSLRAPVGGLREKIAFVRWALTPATRPIERLLAAADGPYGASLDTAGVTGPLRRGVVDPFLAGVLGTDDQQTSRRFVGLLMRSFARGTPSLPSLGMGAIGAQLAAGLPARTVRLGVRVAAATGTGVVTDHGPIDARAVVVAADPVTAGSLAGVDVPHLNALTTFWHVADQAPTRSPMLHLDLTRRGPLVNSLVISNAVPSYSPDGRALIASTMLGCGADRREELERQLARVYGADTTRWDLLRVDEIRGALPAMPPPLVTQRPVDLGDGRFVAGDHRDTASLQGALVSGRRAAAAVADRLGVRWVRRGD